jgi:ParB family chromosome partitioning protein
MGSKLYGAAGRGDVLNFDPNMLKVITDPKHPQYDPRVEREIDEALVLSIMRLGIIEPLVVTRDGDNVIVVDGRQRRACAIEANRRLKAEGGEQVLAPCIWRRGDNAKLYEVMVAANEVRTGDSPLERARKMQHLADMGRDEEQIAIVFGCDKRTVKSALALLECASSVQRAVDSERIPITVAVQLAKLPRDEQSKKLEEMESAGATRGKKAKKALAGEKQENGLRVRSRRVIERLRQELSGHDDLTCIIDFVLGFEMRADKKYLVKAADLSLGREPAPVEVES